MIDLEFKTAPAPTLAVARPDSKFTRDERATPDVKPSTQALSQLRPPRISGVGAGSPWSRERDARARNGVGADGGAVSASAVRPHAAAPGAEASAAAAAPPCRAARSPCWRAWPQKRKAGEGEEPRKTWAAGRLAAGQAGRLARGLVGWWAGGLVG